MTNNSNYPRCIYLDSNILRRIPATDLGTTFLELQEWAKESQTPIVIPEVVWLEWINDFDVNLTKKAAQTKSYLYDFEKLLNIKPNIIELPDDYFQRLIKSLRDRLNSLSISITKTPKNISLNELVTMAAFKIRPFEEKNEKGFRDTIILYTILEDMKLRKIKDSVFVTDDAIFKHSDVLKIVNKYKVSLEILTSIDDASTHIKGITDKHIQRIIEIKKKKLIDFVKTKQENVFKLIKEKAELTEDFITKGGFLSSKQDIFGQIESVVEFEPVQIINAFETGKFKYEDGNLIEDETYPKNIDPILISVETRLKVVYSPIIPFNSPRVKAQELHNFKNAIRNSNPQFYGQPREELLNRTLTVSARILKDDKGKYIDLEFDHVSTF